MRCKVLHSVEQEQLVGITNAEPNPKLYNARSLNTLAGGTSPPL